MTTYAVEGLNVDIAGRRVVEDLSFAIAAGECLALVGASGSGKSQSCLAPFGLSPGVPSGSVRLQGRELISLEETALRPLRAGVGFIFQQPLSALTPHLTIDRQLSEAFGRRMSREMLAVALAEVEIDRPQERLRQYPHQLSGGQRQRIMIACAVARSPSLLIADEPTTALDAPLRHGIMALLDRLRRERGMALLLVSHDLPAVARHSDRLIVMRDGKMMEQGKAAAVFAAPGTAYTQALIAATPKPDGPVPMLPKPGPLLLEAGPLTVRYSRPGLRSGSLLALDGATLSLRVGEAVAIVGGSGSGKSTFARALLGLTPPSRTQGTVRWHGAGKAQAVFQDPLGSLDPQWTVADVIAEPLRWMRPTLARPDREARVVALMHEVELPPECATARPVALSGGQAQRVALARALASNPAMLVLDEATSALDVLVQAQIIALVRRLQQQRGMAMVMITHDTALARQLCHRSITVNDGKILEGFVPVS